MSSVLDIPQHTLNEHADLQRLGLDSLASIEAHHSLCSSLKVKLPENLFMSCKTVKDIQDTIGRCLERDNALGHTVAIASPPKVPPRPFNLPRIEACVNVHSPNLLHPSSVIIRETLASILDVPTSQIQEKTTLVRLGMDSLMVIEARHALSTSLQIELPQDLFTCRTVGELELMIASRLYTAPITPPHRLDENAIIEANPVLLQDVKQSQKDSLFLIHDGSGSSQCYRMLCSLGRKVWGIHNPQLGTEEIWEDGIMTMAKFYADLIVRELAGETRCIIGGKVLFSKKSRQTLIHRSTYRMVFRRNCRI